MTQNAQLLYVLSGKVRIMANDSCMPFGVGEFFVVPNFSEVTVDFQQGQSRLYL